MHEDWEEACALVDKLLEVFKRCATEDERKAFESRIDHLDLRLVAADIVENAISKRGTARCPYPRRIIREVIAGAGDVEDVGEFTDRILAAIDAGGFVMVPDQLLRNWYLFAVKNEANDVAQEILRCRGSGYIKPWPDLPIK